MDQAGLDAPTRVISNRSGGRHRGALPPHATWSRAMELPPLQTDLYDRLRKDVRHRGIQIPILVDSSTGEVIDG